MWMNDQNLISKENGQIFVGSEEFNSATSALGAYIDIFKTGNHVNTNSKPVGAHERKVGDLLLPKPCLQVTAERSLDDGIDGTPYEIHLFNQKKKIEKQHEILLSSSVNTDVISQADQTVKETAAFLDNFQTRRMSPAPLCCVSDIGSMTTEYLLSASPYPPHANPIERDQNGVCKKCGSCSEWNFNDKQTIPKTRSDILKKSSLPLSINSYLSLNSYFAHMSKSSKNIQNCFVNNDVHTGIPGKVKKITKDKKKVCMDSTDKEVCSPHVELRKAERLTCPKADWQNVDSGELKDTKVLTSTFDNCKNAKIKPLRKIRNNTSPNKYAKNPLLTPSKTDFLQTPSPYSKIQQNIAKKIPKSECKANLSKNILHKSTSSQTSKELAKCTQSKNGQEFATMKKLKSVQEKNPNPLKNLVSRNQKSDFSSLTNSLEIAEKHNFQNSSVNEKISKTIKKATKSGIISKEILCSPKKTNFSNTLESAHFHSLSISSIPNQSQTFNESILPDNQKDHKKSITNCELLSNYPQVPDWVKQLESSITSTRIETPTLPIDEVSCQIPAQQVSPPNLTQSWSLSGIPLISPKINHNKTSHSLPKNSDSNYSLREYHELFKDNRNVDTCDQAQFHSQSIQGLLDRYLNDQTKELSKLKSRDNLTDESFNNSNSQSGQPADNCASHRSSCLNSLSTPPLSPVSCEAILDYRCFDKSEEMLKFPFLSSTPKKGHQCHCNSDSMHQTKSDPVCDEFELQDAESDKHRCMETLKNMLFRLQVEEESMRLSEESKSFSLCQSEDPKKNSSFPGISPTKNAADNHEILSLSADNAGFASIDKAFDHLNRLRAVLNGYELPDL